MLNLFSACKDTWVWNQPDGVNTLTLSVGAPFQFQASVEDDLVVNDIVEWKIGSVSETIIVIFLNELILNYRKQSDFKQIVNIFSFSFQGLILITDTYNAENTFDSVIGVTGVTTT